MNGDHARLRMNQLGSEGVPFFFMLDFELLRAKVYPLKELPDTVSFSTPLFSNLSRNNDSEISVSPVCKVFPVPFEEYEKAFNSVQHYLSIGNSFLLNLTFPSRIVTEANLEEIFYSAKAKYKLLLKDECVTFSPESFLQIKGGVISTNPMKGTIRADLPDAREVLLSNVKETAEHDTTIDLLRNDLSIHASGVHLSRYRYIETLTTHHRNLLQMSSEIKGELSKGYESLIGDIICSMLPAGSISGAPKRETIRIIQEVEGQSRGYYTGVFGCFKEGVLDAGVMIRFIEKRDEALYFRSGCGITAMSTVEEEYQEMIDKIYLT
jgi:para-aminobenzoate synthetase component 1